jgi:hypothetical protein
MESTKSFQAHSDYLLAVFCHSAWYAYTVQGLGEEGEPWETAPTWQKESILEGVALWNKLYKDNPEVTRGEFLALSAEASHQNWMACKLKDGWCYGSVKDPSKKTHPCLVSYEELPESQRKKDDVVLSAYWTFRKTLDI